MRQGTRTAGYDERLRVEAFRLTGVAQPFPSHFHDHYVVGLMEEGERRLTCQNREYILRPGDMVLFQPGDSHGCVQRSGGAMDYRGLNLSRRVMWELTGELTGTPALPGFSQSVITDGEANSCLRALHDRIMDGDREFEGEELLFSLLSLLLRRYGKPFEAQTPCCREEVERVCAYIRRHYARRISLAQLCDCAGLSRAALLRAFAREKGITPYRYLEAVRIDRAKQLLQQGVPPAEAALRTGFSDQSHFTRYFSRLIGVAPGVYREIFEDRSGGRGAEHGT